MALRYGILALLEAKSGKGDDLGAFLENGRAIAAAEEGTVTWYAFKLGPTSYGIFDTFETEDARTAHLEGEIPKALTSVAPELLAREPDIRMADLVAVK
jgi:quinol monooxygenase YgiN